MTDFFVDTNVFVYALDDADPAKQKLARHIVGLHGNDIVISTQVMLELHSACTRKLGMTSAGAANALKSISHIRTVSADRQLLLDAAELATDSQISIFDALMVRAAQRAGCDTLITEDLSDGQTFGDVTVVNPFSPAAAA